MQTRKIIIEQRKGLTRVDWKELWAYKDLFLFMTLRNIKTRYAQSSLGVGWALLQPFFSMLVYTVIFGRLAKIDSNGVPYAIFSYMALVPWTYFANAMTEGSSSLVSNAHMLSKVYFPRLILPISSIVARGLDFVIALTFLLVLMVWFQVTPTWNVLFLPLLVTILLFAATGFGLWFSALAIQYRDIAYAMNFIVQLLMYAAPVVYPTSIIPEPLHLWYAINPMVGVIEGFRSAFLGTIPMPWSWIAIGSISSLVLFTSGIVYFRSRERHFADVA